ncbi:MAG: N-6 DNA methylase [Acidobacteria bacterium]|nr:N-6 DNA methylase [Acidobacteriota bacterium]
MRRSSTEVIPGIRGHLISASFVQASLLDLPGAEEPTPAIVRALEVWGDRRDASLGPASSVRAIAEIAVIPLLKLLGFHLSTRQDDAGLVTLTATSTDGVPVPVAVVSWEEPLDRVWRRVVLHGVLTDARWCLCSNGVALRIVDARNTWSRHFLEFDLALVGSERLAQNVLWSLIRANTLACQAPLLDRARVLSDQHGSAVSRALGDGMIDALGRVYSALAAGRPPRPPQALFEQSLTVLYRIVFLLFAEARGLVPMWHPIYRDRYSIEAIVETLLAGKRHRGTWRAILAISRLAHAGCSAGELKVTAFNGRLFSPAYSAAFDRTPVADDVLGDALMAVGSTPMPARGRTRLSYSDLDVEQLGAVYERVLEYEPTGRRDVALRRTRELRQSSGTFYTPRTVVAFLVRQTLEPLVRGRSSSEILGLRVLDPAMGSGAFLVGACRYLAWAVEEASIREGRWHPGDVTAADRASVRREVAQRCLYGVDLNPMAVQLARLSLWLATLASDKPLTFLDHHLTCGDSLVGASLNDLLRQPPGTRPRTRQPDTLPLFEPADLAPTIEHAVKTRLRLASDPDDSAAIVVAKEKTLAALSAGGSPLSRWSAVLDLWCACWFWEDDSPPTRALFRDLSDRLLGKRTTLPERISSRFLEHSAALSTRCRFLHWPLSFPEVFCDAEGNDLPVPGFDAVVGNPPWDMVRGDSGDADTRADGRAAAKRLTEFARHSGVYRVESRSHANRYQLFVERSLQLIRAGGRIGLVLPSGILSDAGSAPLRRHLFERAELDSITGLDNRRGIFPIHRSLRFVLLTGTTGRPTLATACRFGITSTEDLEQPVSASARLVLTQPLLTRVSGEDDLGIPEVVSACDLAILEKISARFPWLGSENGWNVRFGRELNATDDSGAFVAYSGSADARPVLEGKQIDAFRVSVGSSRYELRSGARVKDIARRSRLGFRDVASATNKLTLIAAVLPARAVTTHTLSCLKTPLSADGQHVLCALMNSFVANYLVRLRVNTHVTVALVSRLPVPLVPNTAAPFAQLARLARALTAGNSPAEDMPEYPALQALAARLYGLSENDLEHILGTFPLVPSHVKEATLREFRESPRARLT